VFYFLCVLAEAIKLMREGWAGLNIEVALELLSNQFQVSNDTAALAIR
jgi:hypothetical protein